MAPLRANASVSLQHSPVPDIGIGASCACDGQILVSEDMLSLFDDLRPKFIHHFSNLKVVIAEAAAFYRQAVNDVTFRLIVVSMRRLLG